MENKIGEQSWGSISELGVKPEHKIGNVSPLFSKIEDSDIQKHKQKLGMPSKEN